MIPQPFLNDSQVILEFLLVILKQFLSGSQSKKYAVSTEKDFRSNSVGVKFKVAFNMGFNGAWPQEMGQIRVG